MPKGVTGTMLAGILRLVQPVKHRTFMGFWEGGESGYVGRGSEHKWGPTNQSERVEGGSKQRISESP